MKGSSSMASIVSARSSLWNRKRVSPISTASTSMVASSSSSSSMLPTTAPTSATSSTFPQQYRSSSPLQAAAERTPGELIDSQSQAQAKADAKAAAEAAHKAAVEAAEQKNLLEREYQADVKTYMYEMERQTLPTVELIDQQPELQWYMRPYLIDFLIEIHQQHRLRPETLYLAVNIVDRYVSRRIVFKKHYQLVGCAALWIAAKFEDAKDRVPTVPELCQLCSGAYDESAFVQMEGHVLSTINWALGHPTAESWLRLSCVTNGIEDHPTQHIARFVMELTLFQKEYIAFKPSDIARASLLLACFMVGQSRRVEDESETVLRIATLLDCQLAERLDGLSLLVLKKYSEKHYSKASLSVRQWYLSGQRFSYFGWSSSSPMRRGLSSSIGSGSSSSMGELPSSAELQSSPSHSGSSASSSASSESGDDEEFEEPITPNTPAYGAVSPYVPNPADLSPDVSSSAVDENGSHEDYVYNSSRRVVDAVKPADRSSAAGIPAVRPPLNRASWEMNNARPLQHYQQAPLQQQQQQQQRQYNMYRS